jgi:hypothetical protein
MKPRSYAEILQADAQVTPTELERSNVLVSIDRQLLRS